MVNKENVEACEGILIIYAEEQSGYLEKINNIQ